MYVCVCVSVYLCNTPCHQCSAWKLLATILCSVLRDVTGANKEFHRMKLNVIYPLTTLPTLIIKSKHYNYCIKNVCTIFIQVMKMYYLLVNRL